MQHQDQAKLQDSNAQSANADGTDGAYGDQNEQLKALGPVSCGETETAPHSLFDVVEHLEVVCEAILGQGQITVGRLTELQVDDLIKLDRTPADPIDIRVNGRTIARGEIVTIDDRFAIRLTQIG